MEFDPAKDAANLAKHGVSLSRAAEMTVHAVEVDGRFAHEERFRAFGMIDGLPHSFAFTTRGRLIRAISLRRSHIKEYRRHVR